MHYWLVGIRVFLACVLLASAWSKRGSEWPNRLATYGLLPNRIAYRVAPVIPVGEAAVAIVLVAAGQPGLVAGGITFLAFGTVVMLARLRGYEGSCGCSKSGRVSWLAALRGLGWGTLALGLGVSSLLDAPAAALAMTASLELTTVLATMFVLQLLTSYERGKRNRSVNPRVAAPHVGLSGDWPTEMEGGPL